MIHVVPCLAPEVTTCCVNKLLGRLSCSSEANHNQALAAVKLSHMLIAAGTDVSVLPNLPWVVGIQRQCKGGRKLAS